MPINYPNLPQHLTRNEIGSPDLGAAIQQGFTTAGMGMEAAYKPKTLAEALLHSQLSNKLLQADIPYRARLHESALRAAEDAHRRAMLDTDPRAKIDYYNRLIQGFDGITGADPEDMGQDFPEEDTGSIGGLNPTPGANQMRDENSQYDFSMDGPGIAKSASAYDTFPGRRKPGRVAAGPSQVSGNIPLKQLMYRAMMKNAFGIDPYQKIPETPEQRMARELDMFKKKEDIRAEKAKEKELLKAQQEEKLPAAIRTLHENIIHLSPKAIQAIDQIIDLPSPFEPWGFGAIKSGQKAAHNKAVTAAAENYSKAKGWPNTKGSIEKAESILQRGNFETDYDYRKRLKGYQEELKQGIKSSNDFLHPNKEPEQGNEDPLDLVIEYVRRNGKLVPK